MLTLLMRQGHSFWVMTLLMFGMLVIGAGCVDNENLTGSDDAFTHDPYIYGLAEEFWNESLYNDKVAFQSFVEEVEALDHSETEALIAAIDEIAEQRTPPSEQMRSASIRVYWSWWPSGRYPSSVWATTSCGGDYDVGLRYNNVRNAYSNPWGMWFETNNSIVYGFTRAHGNNILAFSITGWNTVYACVGVGSGNFTYVNAVKNYFWGGLAINP